VTTGRIYEAVITKERRGEYLGHRAGDPHITDEIKARIRQATDGADMAIIEVGGTVATSSRCRFWRRFASSSSKPA